MLTPSEGNSYIRNADTFIRFVVIRGEAAWLASPPSPAATPAPSETDRPYFGQEPEVQAARASGEISYGGKPLPFPEF